LSPPYIALGIIALVVLATVIFGLLAVRRLGMNPEQYIVGGRSFGALLLWVLLAGETYTSFTFLGAAGWSYGRGAPAFYILCYGAVAYAISYFLAPLIWRVGKDRGLLTAPDFFADRYGSKSLAVVVALVGFVFLIPYVTLQLSGLQILLTLAGYGTIDARLAVGGAFILITLFVFVSGLRGTAWASIIKDALVLAAVAFAGIVLPVHFFGSPAHVISMVLAKHPRWFTLASGTAPYGTLWFVTTVILTALGFYMWPQSMAAIYSAKTADALRRNAIALPFYQIMLLLVYLAGFTALLIVPGLKGAAADESFMLVIQKYYSPTVLGFIAAAGCLAALVPVTGQLIAAASLITKNIMKDVFNASGSQARQTAQTRAVVVMVAGLALAFWLFRPPSLVELLLLGYNGVAQLFPGVMLAFTRWRASAWGVGVGIIAGIVTLVVLQLLGHATDFNGANPGLVALGVNALLCVVVSAFSRRWARAEGALTAI